MSEDKTTKGPVTPELIEKAPATDLSESDLEQVTGGAAADPLKSTNQQKVDKMIIR